MDMSLTTKTANDTPSRSSKNTSHNTSHNEFADDMANNSSFVACRFTGVTSEYFKIWIVNIALMLVTLGIYSAWAKVRRNQYIYGNTLFDNSSFVYHADPKSILIGRLLAFIPFVIFAGLVYYNPIAANVGAYGLFFVAPFFIVRAIQFRWRITTYRGAAFGFAGSTRQAYKVYLLWPVLAALSFFILYPKTVHFRKKWLVSQSFFGNVPFTFSGTVKPLFWIYIRVAVFLLLLGLITVILMQQNSGNLSTIFWGFHLGQLITMGALVIAALAYVYLHANVTNYVWDHTQIKTTHFKGTLSTRRLTFIYVTNLIAIIVSLGLLIPWSVMRITRYRVESVHYQLRDAIDDVVGPGAKDKSALGEETFGMFDMDIG